MVVTVAEQTLIVPLTAIIETLQPRAADMHEMGDGARVMSIRGTYVPLIAVGAALGWANREGVAAGGVALLVEGEDGTRAVLLVDAIQGQRQVVIKSLEANYRRVPGVAAATYPGRRPRRPHPRCRQHRLRRTGRSALHRNPLRNRNGLCLTQ